VGKVTQGDDQIVVVEKVRPPKPAPSTRIFLEVVVMPFAIQSVG
jgi:hypothetical protein